MEKYKELWLHVEIYNPILIDLIKNFKDNKNYYIMLNIKSNSWKEKLLEHKE